MKKFSTLSMASIALATLSFLTSCQDEDFGYTEQQIKTSKFAKNFEDEYGAINPEQSWDLTRTMARTSKYSPFTATGTQTRSALSGYTETPASEIATYTNPTGANNYEGWYDVESATISWFTNELKETKNNTSKGQPFSLVAPANGFSLIPIFQGEAGMDWQLHLVDLDTNKDYTIWSESQGMLRSNDGYNWSTIPTVCVYGDNGLIKDQSSATFGFSHIKSQPININITEGHNIILYLKVTNGQWADDGYGSGNYAKTGAEQRSDEGMMLALSCPIPTNVGQTGDKDNFAMIIGCEDADGNNSDWDMNDVCFLLIGHPYIPDRISYTSKRYMCEDLGNTYDFDFNDIVVDVTEATYYSAVNTVQDGGNTYVSFQKNTEKTKQYATIAHVCGTLPFQVTVGNYSFPVVEDPTDKTGTLTVLTRADGWNPDETPNVKREITGWNPETHNITINVAKQADNKNIDVLKAAFGNGTVEEEDVENHIYRIGFPGRGKAPLIIAVDPTIGWMDEHVHIPESWWKTGSIFDENAGSGSDSQHSSDKLSLEVSSLPWTDYRLLSYGNGIANNMVLLPSCFNSMSVGDNISITTTGNLNLHYANPAGWETISTGRYNAGSNNEPGTMILKIADETMLNTLKQYGLGFNGDKVTVTHIESYTPVQYTLKLTAGDHGLISVDGGEFVKSFNQSVDAGAHTIKAKGESGYTLDKWSDDVTTKSRTIDIQSNLELSASFKESDYINLWEGVKNSDWNNNPQFWFDQNQTFNAGDKIILTGEGTNNFKLKFGNNWSPEATPTVINSVFEVVLTQDMANVLNSDHFFRITDVNGNLEITSIDLLPPAQYTINVASADAGQGSVEIVGKSGSTFKGTGDVQLKATPVTGYKFVSWTKPDGSTSTENPLTVTLSESTAGNYTATFAEITKVTITASSNNLTWGTVNTAGGEYYEGNSVTLTAEATNNGVFVNWTKDGNSASTEATLNLIASESTAGVYQAIFREKLSYSVTLTAGENGTAEITTSPNAADNKYFEGTSVTLSATPEDGFKVARWTKNGNTISGENRNTLTIIVSNEDTYGVEFEEYVAPAEIVLWEGSFSGQFQALAYGGQNNKQNGASKTLIECLDSGLTKLKFTFDKTSNVWYQILGAKENGTGNWHMLIEGNTNGSTLEVDLSSYVATIKTEDGIVLQGGDYGNLTKIEAYQ